MNRLALGLALAAAFPLAAGCGGGGSSDGGSTGAQHRPGGAGGRGRVCTEIGCDSGLQVNFQPITAKLPKAKDVRVCLEDRCRTFRSGARFPLVVDRGLRSERMVRVTLTATDASGHVLLHEARSARLRRVQPNGPRCAPVCFQALLHLNRVSLKLVPRLGTP